MASKAQFWSFMGQWGPWIPRVLEASVAEFWPEHTRLPASAFAALGPLWGRQLQRGELESDLVGRGSGWCGSAVCSWLTTLLEKDEVASVTRSFCHPGDRSGG